MTDGDQYKLIIGKPNQPKAPPDIQPFRQYPSHQQVISCLQIKQNQPGSKMTGTLHI